MKRTIQDEDPQTVYGRVQGHLSSRVGYFLAVKNREAVNLLQDIANMDRRRRRPAINDPATQRP